MSIFNMRGNIGSCHLLQAVWPPLLKNLLQILESDQQDSAQAALLTFQLLCEDHIDKLCTSSDLNEILNMMISRFISLFASPDADIRRIAINCSRQFILPLPNAFLVNLNPFLQVPPLVPIASSRPNLRLTKPIVVRASCPSPKTKARACARRYARSAAPARETPRRRPSALSMAARAHARAPARAQALCALVEVKADFLADGSICQFVIEFLLWTTGRAATSARALLNPKP
jgi:hypothetical protein